MSGCNSEFGQALDELVRGSEIVIDRPKGTAHPDSRISSIRSITAIGRTQNQWTARE